MSVKITDVVCNPNGECVFHFTVCDDQHREALLATLTLEEAHGIAKGKNSGDVFSMCRAIIEAADHRTLIGRTFGEAS